MLYTDLREAKAVLEIDPDDDSEDRNITFWIEYASALIEEFLCRPGMLYKERTEYYNGTNTRQLVLKSRPVYTTPTIQVYEESNGFYGQPSGSFASTSQLTYGTDFVLKIDQDNGTSRCGILLKKHAYWPKATGRVGGYLSPFVTESFGSIKVIYTAGYTVETLPAPFRLAADMLVARIRYIFPLGMEMQSESYEERNISLQVERKEYLMALIKPILFNYKNWNF